MLDYNVGRISHYIMLQSLC